MVYVEFLQISPFAQIVFLDPQNAPKSLATGASPQTPLGELTALPRPPGLRGPTSKGPTSKGSGGKGRGGEGREFYCVIVLEG